MEIIMAIDWTPILVAVITILGGILTGIVVKYVVPWLKENHLLIAAQIVVEAAEAAYGRYNGDQKWAAAMDALKEKGFNVDSAQVIAAVKAAWKQLDLKQIAAGEKDLDIIEEK